MIRTEMIAPIATLLEERVKRHPDKAAYSDAARTVSWREVASESRNLAGHLRDAGLADGQAVAVWLPNGVDFALACLAIVQAGGVAVPISLESSESEVHYRLEDSASVLVIALADRSALLDRIDARLACAPGRILSGVGMSGGGGTGASGLQALFTRPPRSTRLAPDDIDRVGYIVYTSGTTGRPKGVELCSRSLMWVTAACWAPILGYCEDDSVLSPLPLFHSFALSITILAPVSTGAHVHIMERFSSHGALELLRSGRFSFMPGVPTMFHYLKLAAEEAGDNPFAGLRLCVSAGAIMQATLGQEFERRFGVELLDSYGITEMSTMVTMNWPRAPREPGSCGLPIPGMALRIIDQTTGKDAAYGGEGELICRSPTIMLGYHNQPDQTAQTVRDGWYHTGDLARFDANGYVTITGRLKEIIIRGGQNIAPAEVEEALMQHPAVRDCAVVGLAHPHLGEICAAFIVRADGAGAAGEALDEGALRAHCAARLSGYKVPERFHLVAEIPRTGSGKIMRYRLRDMVAPA
jgi:long-chain acyl-CoA synthetase